MGSLTGQNGWTSQGTAVATVQNSVVASGSQAVSLSGTATTWHWPSVGYTPASGELIRLNADIRRGSSAATAKNFGYFIDVYDNTAGSRIGRVGIANNAGSLVGIATTKDAGGTVGNYILQSGMQWDTWYNFKMELDFAGHFRRHALPPSASSARARQSSADLCIVDPHSRWTVSDKTLFSRCKNSPFVGWELTGKVTHTLLNGRIVYTAA